MSDKLPPEDQQIVDAAMTINTIIEQLTPEQAFAWIVEGDEAALGGVGLMPSMRRYAEVMRKLLLSEYRQAVEQRDLHQLRCPKCHGGMTDAMVTWSMTEQSWVIRCVCGGEIEPEVRHE